MDKLGLLSLQVPILPTRGETGDRRGSMFMAAAEPLPLRYTPPQSLTATADAVTECVQREGDALRAGSSSVAFAAAETSSSCSSCFWDDKLNNTGKSCSADAGIVCRNACITDGSSAAHKEELEKAATGGPQSLLTKSVEQRETRPRPASLTLEKCSIVAAAKRQKDNWSAAGTMTSSDGVQEKSNRIEADSDSAAATLRQARGREPHRGSTYYDHTRVKTELLPRTSEHGADAEDTAGGVTDDTMSMVEAATSPPVECSTKENSRALQTAVAGVGSCNKLKGSSMDESACGTGTPTTRFSTEQEEDTAAAPPSGPQHKYGASAAAAGSSTGVTSSEQNFSCGGGHSALLPMDGEKDNLPSYEKMPSSSEGGYTSANLPAVNTTDSLELARQDADHQQNRRSKQQSWKHDTHQREIQAVELQAQSQSQHVDKGTLRSHDNTSFSHQDQNMNSLLAVAAAMVEEHVNGLTYVRKDATSHGRRVRSEEAPEDKEAAVRAAAAALASIRHRDMDYDEFDSLDAPGKASTEATGAAPRSSGERAACLQKGRIAEGQEAADTLALALSLDAVMLGVGQEAARFSNTCSLDHDNESYPAPPQTRCEGNEGSTLHSQNKKQTGPTEKVNTYSSHNPHSAAAKVAASTAAPDGAAERSVVTRGAGGRTTQVQHTNGNVYAAELPEDPELIECLKGLLTALPRKKDAEARSLLSGEMRFVRPYALQIVEVWKIHLGEAGRTALKKDISERTQADPALKRRVLAISKLKMATLEELVQIAELADLLVRTLQIANMYETERQVASVTRQSTSRRAINAAAYAAPSQTPPAATQANTYYVGSTAASTSTPGGNSSPLASVNLSAAGVPGGGSTDRSSSATSSAQTNGTTHHPGASSCSPSRTPLPAPTVTPPAASSPQAQRQNNPVSPRSRNAYSTNALLSPEIESSTSGTAAGADENAPSSESSHNFLEGLTAKGICLINDDSPPLTYESIERFASSRLRGLPMESISLPTPPISADRNLGARIRSPSANSDDRSHQGGVSADAGQSSSNSSIHQQQQPHMHGNEQQLQQSHQQLQPQQLLQKHIQQKQQHQQAFSGANETESCYLEVDATQEMREPLSGPQHSSESTESGARKELQALLPPSTSVMGDSRSGVASVSPQWEGAPEKRAASNVKQQEITSMKMPSQQRRSQQMSDCSEKDEDVIRAADLLAAVAELRVSVPPGVSVSHGKTDVSSSSPVEHDELFGGCNLESAAADALSSPCARALLAAVGDNYRLSRLLEVSSLGCLENSGISKRLYLDQDVLKLLRLAAMSGEEITTTAFHSQVGASQGSNSSSSSEAEGAAAREVDGELCHKEQRPVRRKRMRRPAKTAIRNGSRNRNAGGHRECRLDDADTALLQQLHQQLQQLHQQQVTEAREATGEELSAALAGEVHACMSALEAEAAARSRDPLPPARPAAPLDKKKSSEVGEDRLTAQDVRHDADREDEGSESRRRDRIFAEAATLLQSSARNHRRCLPAGHSAIVADCVEDLNAIVGTNAEALHSKTRCKATWATEEESDYQCNIGNLTEGTFLDSEKEGRSNGMISIRSANSRDAGARLLRKKEEENEISGAGRSSEERAAAADATEERLGGGIDKDVSARSGAKNDTDVESRGSAAGRNAVGRTATYRTSSAIDTILGSSADNGNNNFHKGRNGIRQGPGENLSSAAPYNTRRSAAAAAGTCVAEGGEICFTDTTRSSSSYGGSRLIARNTLQGEAEGKGTAAEKHDKDLSAPGGFGDSVAEQCAREAKQLLERAFKVNDALGFLPASYRLMVGGFSREQETSSSGNNSGTGVRGKRSREQASASELDTCAVLQLLATVCLMCLKGHRSQGYGSNRFRRGLWGTGHPRKDVSSISCSGSKMAKVKDQMLQQLLGAPAQTVQLTPYEVQHLIRALTTPSMEEIGSSAWYAHHEVLQRLNFFAHEQASSGTDEFVMDTFVTADKITNLIEDLITIEVWKDNVYPLLQDELAALPSIKSYLLMYHEALLVNLLEVLLFHKTAAQAGEDHLADLVDYINRKVVYVLSRDAGQLHYSLPKEVKNFFEPLEDLPRQRLDCEFRICMSCLSLLRFLTDHRAALPVTVTSRLLDQHDILLSLVSLMDRKPWYRQRSNGNTEFFEDQQWIVKRSDEASMPKLQAQVWLTIYNLVMDQECRNRYELTSYRKDNLLRLRRHLNEVVYDQIPPLMGLHRALEYAAVVCSTIQELSIMGHHPNQNTSMPPILVELSAEIKERLLATFAGRWEDVACKQKKFLRQGSAEELQRLSNLVLSVPFDKFTTTKRCRACGRYAEQRCSRCKAEWYCCRDCQVSDWRNHKSVCVTAEASTINA